MQHSGFLLNVPVHPWLKTLEVAFVPPLFPRVAVDNLRAAFQQLGHRVPDEPQPRTDVLLTSAPFGEALNWRRALLFTARRRFRMQHAPLVWTLIPVTPARLQAELDHLAAALRRDPPDPEDFAYPGLSPRAWQTLLEQGRRGGPLLALERVVQAQAKSIRVLLLVGEEQPAYAYLFDLVGAHPRIALDDPQQGYLDIALRMATVAGTREVTQHQVLDDPVPAAVWQSCQAPQAMRRAAVALGRRGFFTPMVRISDLVAVPAVEASISRQYSEGCFATWEPRLEGLVATVTGSARPVAKDAIQDDDLALIVGVRPDGQGAVVRPVEGLRNDPPSSEAVELFGMDQSLPRVRWDGYEVPVARSKLHGHRGVRAFDPSLVEFVPLDEPYYHFPVSCATDAQARGIIAAFGRAESLRNPDDPRRLAFTLLPGHGVVMVEKWTPNKAPFQVIWEALDTGQLVIDSHVPQGVLHYRLATDGRMTLVEG